MHGTIAFFHDRKKYGFIESEEADDDVFFHVDDLPEGESVEEGTEVEFEAEESPKGPKVTSIEIL